MKIKILQGLPAAGKTSWAREYTKKHPDWVRVNRDDLRNMRGEYWIPKQENMISLCEEGCVISALASGHNVILDATNLNPKYLQKWKDIAKKYKAKIEYKKFLDVDVDECIKRDLARANSVGRAVIMGMYEKYIKKEEQELYLPDESLPSAVIVDVDGTLALMGDRSPFDWDRVKEDTPNQAVIDLVQTLHSKGMKIVICTGRDGVCVAHTKCWLLDHNVPFDDFYMREEGNDEPDEKLKERFLEKGQERRFSILEKYNVQFVLDDRDKVVRMWRRKGLVCLQVAEGRF